MEALNAILQRRSIRKYQSTSMEKNQLEEVVNCGRMAATARNEQPWEFVVIRERSRLNAVAALTDYGKFIAQAAACIAVFCKETKYYLEDGAAAVQNMMVGAYALGIGTCWVAGDKKPYARTVAELLNVPGNYKLIALVALGYPAETPAPPKRELAEVLHWETF